MSKNSTDDSAAAKPAKKAAKKVAEKKAPAKKAAKKVAKKTIAKSEVPAKARASSTKPKAPLAEPKAVPAASAPAPKIEAKPLESVAAPKPIEAPVLPAPRPPSADLTPYSPPAQPTEARDTQRTGRVPGGGPIQSAAHHAPRTGEGGFDPNQPRESRSKKRRDKRKRRREPFGESGNRNGNGNHNGNGNPNRNDWSERQPMEDRSPIVLSGPVLDVSGILEMTPKGFGFLRLAATNFEQAKDDVSVSSELIRNHSLRHGQWIQGKHQESNRGPQLIEITSVNDMPPETAAKLPHFDELKAINPNKRIAFETTPDRYTTRVVDIVAPVGRGQRGLIARWPRPRRRRTSPARTPTAARWQRSCPRCGQCP